MYAVVNNTGTHLIVVPIQMIDPDEVVDDYWSVTGPALSMSYDDADIEGVVSDIHDQLEIDAIDATEGSLIGEELC